MSNIKTETPSPAIIIAEIEANAMRDAGATAIASTQPASAILTHAKVDARNSELCLAYQALFYEGAIMRGVNVDVTEAKRRLALGSAKNAKLDADKRRDDATETVYGAAKTQWSRACDGAGLPKLHIGGNRGANGKAGNEATKDAPIAVEAFHVPNNLDTAGIVALFGKFADAMSRCVDANAARIVGDAGAIVRQWTADNVDYVKDAAAALAADAKARPLSALAKVEAEANAKALAEAQAMLATMRAELAAERAAKVLTAAQAEKVTRAPRKAKAKAKAA